VGKKTSDFLKGFGYNTHFIPEIYTAESLLESIDVCKNDKILIPQSSLSDEFLYKGLTKKKCYVEKFVVYENIPNKYNKESIEKIFFEKIDFITFTSGSTVKNFKLLTKKYNINFAGSKVICIGKETKIAAEENGIKVHAVAFPHTIEGILQAIIKLNQE
jgi:uroporphyrinogen III methyltransferase/synthase